MPSCDRAFKVELVFEGDNVAISLRKVATFTGRLRRHAPIRVRAHVRVSLRAAAAVRESAHGNCAPWRASLNARKAKDTCNWWIKGSRGKTRIIAAFIRELYTFLISHFVILAFKIHFFFSNICFGIWEEWITWNEKLLLQ